MREVAIVGAGMTPFAEHFSLGIKDLLPMAFAECAASVDKGLEVGDIQAAWFGELSTTDGFPSGILADTCGLLDVPITHVENACATGNDAVRNAVMGIASGFYDVVLVMGADKVRESASKDTFWEWAGMTRDMAWDYPLGLVAPANFALHVARYLHESPATREHMAMVAVKNHHHAVGNPKAQLRFDITVEQVLNARWWWNRSDSMTAPRRATARPRCCSPPRTWPTSTPTGRSGSAASGSAWTASCTSTSGT